MEFVNNKQELVSILWMIGLKFIWFLALLSNLITLPIQIVYAEVLIHKAKREGNESVESLKDYFSRWIKIIPILMALLFKYWRVKTWGNKFIEYVQMCEELKLIE